MPTFRCSLLCILCFAVIAALSFRLLYAVAQVTMRSAHSPSGLAEARTRLAALER